MQNLLAEKISRQEILQLSREDLVGRVISQQQVIDNQQQVIDNQQQVIEKQNQRIAELEQEVERQKAIRLLDSKTSSKPPSTDILTKSEQKPPELSAGEGEPEKRKPGGQPGHPGKTRKGFDRIDRIEPLRPLVCSGCGETEFGETPIKIEKQQVAQLSERPIEIVEYHRQTCICQNCGAAEVADWSPEMVPGQDIGIGLQAFLAWMNNYGHLSYEKQQELLWELGGIEIGLGTLVTTNERVVKAIAPSVDELKEWIKQTQPNIHVDETPWVVKGVKEWLWIFANTNFALFHAADTRGRVELESILGLSYQGVLSSDDFSAYNGYDVKAQQKCCAHLRRHFKKLLKTPGLHNKEIAEKFINLIDEAFRQYKTFQQSQNREEYAAWAAEFRKRVKLAIKAWIGKAGAAAGLLLRSLRDKAHQWWFFLDHPEIPPDNNLAERTLRLAVTKRKVSGGSRAMVRFQHTANSLTVIQTCRHQGRSVIEFFQQAIKAIVNPAVQAPSLIPAV